MALIPDRAVVLTAASLSVTDVMAEYYADLVNSAWSATDQVPITAGAAGSFAMTLRNAGDTVELNLLNTGTVGTPTELVRLGINPDSSSDPIQDSQHPREIIVGPIPSPAGFDFVDNGVSDDTIQRKDGGSWITDGIVIGHTLTVSAAGTPANNGAYVVAAVTARDLVVAPGSFTDDTDDGTVVCTFHGAANFSGEDDGYSGQGAVIMGSTEFIVLEWPDAIMFIFKDALKTGAPYIWYWGKIWSPMMTAFASLGSVRIDGHAIMHGTPNADAYKLFCRTHEVGYFRWRVGLGTDVLTVAPWLSGWADRLTLGMNVNQVAARTEPDWKFGPANETIILPVVYSSYNTANGGPWALFDNYLRHVPYGNSCFDIWTVGGTNRYMVVWSVATTSALVAVPIPAAFNPSP